MNRGHRPRVVVREVQHAGHRIGDDLFLFARVERQAPDEQQVCDDADAPNIDFLVVRSQGEGMGFESENALNVGCTRHWHYKTISNATKYTHKSHLATALHGQHLGCDIGQSAARQIHDLVRRRKMADAEIATHNV